jgi:hypothetical protein
MTHKVGDKIPVWWTTYEKNDKGENIAFVLEIRDYIGPLDFCDKILKLTCPGTKLGWVEMTVCK